MGSSSSQRAVANTRMPPLYEVDPSDARRYEGAYEGQQARSDCDREQITLAHENAAREQEALK